MIHSGRINTKFNSIQNTPRVLSVIEMHRHVLDQEEFAKVGIIRNSAHDLNEA